VSKAVQRFVVETEKIREDRTCLIYNAANISSSLLSINARCHEREQLGIDEQDVVITIVASLTPNKGHGVLLDAFAQVVNKHPLTKLLVVGAGPLMEKLRDVAGHLGIASKVIFTGQRRDITSLLQLSDISLLPSITREGLGIALIEAMAMGLPLIGTKVGGIPEVIEHNTNGLLVSPGNSPELAAAIVTLVQDGQMRKRMGRKGEEIYQGKFTMAKMIELVENLYEELLEK
jgi:glycosyltransferase involved in cell wall biosynthesis